MSEVSSAAGKSAGLQVTAGGRARWGWQPVCRSMLLTQASPVLCDFGYPSD
ncbi:MAG: hypothetical protein KME26_21740 [Oscillatoria princeps RMCB-10]|nr:hypothetical protein [Oscillatoria princeps RMCB-10]